jgi:hypothetical protein
MIAMTTTPITAALTALLHELAEEIPDVLTQEFSFAALWADLARVAGEPVPRDVAAVLDSPLGFVPVVRGSYAAHDRQFAKLYAD